jgi:hypothetical protein
MKRIRFDLNVKLDLNVKFNCSGRAWSNPINIKFGT